MHTYIGPAWHNVSMHISYLKGCWGSWKTLCSSRCYYSDNCNLLGPVWAVFPLFTWHHNHSKNTFIFFFNSWPYAYIRSLGGWDLMQRGRIYAYLKINRAVPAPRSRRPKESSQSLLAIRSFLIMRLPWQPITVLTWSETSSCLPASQTR